MSDSAIGGIHRLARRDALLLERVFGGFFQVYVDAEARALGNFPLALSPIIVRSCAHSPMMMRKGQPPLPPATQQKHAAT